MTDMGIYYSSVGTRLINYLHHEELTIEDFAVLSPEFVQFIHNLGRKSKTALIERLNELNLNPGAWDGRDNGMTWYEALRYYKEHRLELREKYPPQYINKEPQEPEKPKDDWSEYRKKLAEDVLMLLLKGGSNYPDPMMVAGMAVGYTDALIAELKKIH